MNHYELEKIVNQQLNTAAFSDYAPNGLQVEGRARVKTVITGVTAPARHYWMKRWPARPMPCWSIMVISGKASLRSLKG